LFAGYLPSYLFSGFSFNNSGFSEGAEQTPLQIFFPRIVAFKAFSNCGVFPTLSLSEKFFYLLVFLICNRGFPVTVAGCFFFAQTFKKLI